MVEITSNFMCGSFMLKRILLDIVVTVKKKISIYPYKEANHFYGLVFSLSRKKN